MPKVLNKHKDGFPEGAIYIGNPSKWRNPFVIGPDGTREEVVAKHRAWVYSMPIIMEAIKKELRGKSLVCFCRPKPCHGNTLIEIANS